MKKTFAILLLIIIQTTLSGQTSTSAINNGERNQLTSQILKEDRHFQVYLPPSYHFSTEGSFPVMYVMDGDYNFHFVTGLIEMLIESGKIPEIIIVGISDKGSYKYRNYCKPTNDSEKSGAANLFMEFIEKELRPFVSKTYKASNYAIISGHSLGGLFTTNYYLERSDSFNSYIAIDPSLWWNSNEIVSRADTILKNKKELDSKLYISLAETKGMGVLKFIGVLDTYFPDQKMWHFNHYKNENHGSVAISSIKDALESIFKDWPMTREKYESLKNINELMQYYAAMNTTFQTKFILPSRLLSNAIYYKSDNESELKNMETQISKHFPGSLDEYYVQNALICIEKNELEKAQRILEDNLKKFPKSFKSYDALSQIFLKLKKYEKAQEFSKTAISIAKDLPVRQWTLNEISSNYDKALKE